MLFKDVDNDDDDESIKFEISASKTWERKIDREQLTNRQTD